MGLKSLVICFHLCLHEHVKHNKNFPCSDSVTTGFDSPKVLIISDLVSLVTVAVSARTGTGGNKFVRRPIFANACLNVDLGIEKKIIG